MLGKLKKSLAVLLLFASLLTVGCASDTTSSSASDTTSAASAEETTAVPETEYLETLPKYDGDGRDFMFIVRDSSGAIFSDDVYAEKEIGEPINDAVYTRNRLISERYNVNIAQSAFPSAQVPEKVRSAVLANEAAYDGVYVSVQESGNLALEKMLYNLNDLPNLDLTNEWWDQSANDDLTLAGKLYFTCGDINLTDNKGTWCVMYNKNLIAEYDRDDPYQLMLDNKWTLDSFYNIMKDMAQDLDGDGTMTELDMYGYKTEPYNAYVKVMGAGEQLISKDENDYPIYNGTSERLFTAVDKALKIMQDESTFDYTLHAYSAAGQNDTWNSSLAIFHEGRAIFNVGSMLNLTKDVFRSMDDEYGVVTTPKLDEAQENYYNTISAYNCLMLSVPANCSDPESTGLILEALAYESVETLTYAYYDVTLKEKVARDDNWGKMIDIVLDTRVFDVGNSYSWGSVNDAISGYTGTDYASKFASLESQIEAKLNDAIELIDGLE